MAGAVLASVAGGCSGSGCGGDEDERSGQSAASPGAQQAVNDDGSARPIRDAARPRRAEPAATVARARSARAGGEALEEGDGIEAASWLSTGARGELALDLRGNGRVELGPEAVAQLGDEAPALVFVVSGRARANLPPSGNSARSALRVATPGATIELPRSGDAWIAVRPDATSWLAVLQGRAALMTGAAHDERKPRRWTVGAGKTLRVGRQGPGDLADGPANVEHAAARAERWRRQGAPVAAGKLRTTLERDARALDESLDALGQQRRVGDELRASRDTRTADRRSALVAHSQALHRLRGLVRVRWERVKARALHLQRVGGDDEVRAADDRKERVRKLLGLEGG